MGPRMNFRRIRTFVALVEHGPRLAGRVTHSLQRGSFFVALMPQIRATFTKILSFFAHEGLPMMRWAAAPLLVGLLLAVRLGVAMADDKTKAEPAPNTLTDQEMR